MHQCDIKSAPLSQVPLLVADPPKLSDSFWQFRRELIFKVVNTALILPVLPVFGNYSNLLHVSRF